MRLDKFLANNTGISRSEIKKIIKQGEVLVNDVLADNPAQKVDPENDDVEFDGQVIGQQTPRYYMLNKPKGVVCATKDAEHMTVIDILADSYIFDTDELRIAGRLDMDTTGLILITDDGKWLHQVSSGKKDVGKTYLATLDSNIDSEQQGQITSAFAEGILLRGETKPTRPAELKFLGPNLAKLVIHEGKYHQVKRMFGYFGRKVIELHRSQIDDLILDEGLEPGEARELTQDEVNFFK